MNDDYHARRFHGDLDMALGEIDTLDELKCHPVLMLHGKCTYDIRVGPPPDYWPSNYIIEHYIKLDGKKARVWVEPQPQLGKARVFVEYRQ